MNIIIRVVIFFLSYAIFTNPVLAQGNLVDIDKQFVDYQQKNIQEKLFVHTDKSFYLAGEILWFKMYTVDGELHKPLEISKVAYLEILDKDNNAMVQTKIAVEDGSGSGSVYLPVALNSGSYKLRAYTRWMRNFDPAFYFEKNLTIVNSLKESEIEPSDNPAAVNYDVSFFPEGGNMVADIKNKIGFRGTNQYGKGFMVEGTVVNQEDETVASFRSLKFGIGNFYFMPKAGKYTALINLPNGQTLKKELPEVFNGGYIMHLDDSPVSEYIKIEVQHSSSLNSEVHLFSHTRNRGNFSRTTQMADGKAEFLVDKSEIGEGISSFTIFNKDNEPVCERLYFKRPKENPVVTVSTDATAYTSRKKVDVKLDVRDFKNQPLAADMSVSVFRLDSLHTIPHDISSYLWLTSDLKGTIESPEYYLSENSREVNEAVDNLMLTHGWRRFRWETILQIKAAAPEFVPEFTGHIVTGKMVNTFTGAPARSAMSYLSVPGKRVELYASKSDADGNVNFYTQDFFGPGEILTHTDARKDSSTRITIASPFSSKFSINQLPAFNPYNSRLYNQLVTNSVNVQVQNIFRANQIKQFTSPVTDSSAFYGSAARTYLLDNYTRFTTMEEVLREYVIEAALTVSRKQYELKLMKPELVTFLENPLILLDGIPVFNTNDIIAYDPLKVKAIDVINREYILGSAFFNGIISFRTYNGNSPGLPMTSSTTAFDYEGLQLNREFYSPVYDSESERSSRVPDFRNLLHWSPEIKTDADGFKQFGFYTSDQTGKYAMILQGITTDGNPVSKVLTFEVKNPL